MHPPEFSFKVIVVGEAATGKSCLLQRYLKDQFDSKYAVTIGVDYQTKTVKVDPQLTAKLNFWDTAGHPELLSASPCGIYMLSRKDSFERLDSWHLEALENAPEDAIFVLVGTHLDLPEKREVQKEQALAWTKQAKIHIFFETSAKTSENVTQMFQELCSQLLLKSLKGSKNKQSWNGDGSSLGRSGPPEPSPCC